MARGLEIGSSMRRIERSAPGSSGQSPRARSMLMNHLPRKPASLIHALPLFLSNFAGSPKCSSWAIVKRSARGPTA
eukprot:4684973-Alexandrium_andersonii.AAC.1